MKRRDRGKSLERRIGQEAAMAANNNPQVAVQNALNAPNGYIGNEEKAVMV